MAKAELDVAAGFRLGAYTLTAPIGRGGFAPVWLAKEVWNDVELRTVAVKLFRTSTGEGAAQLIEEARSLCRVEHPNVVRFYAVATTPELFGLVMEYVNGTPLDRKLAEDGKLPPALALAVCGAVASALTAVHAVGLVHRDVKPANVIEAGGVYKLIDFGIAYHTALPETAKQKEAKVVVMDDLPLEEPEGTPSRSSASGLTSGTVGYTDPAALRAPATPASDLYSLGAMLHHFLTGQLPAALAARATGRKGLDSAVLEGRSKPPSLASSMEGANAALVALVDGLLDPDPANRPRAAESVAWEIERIRREIAGHARRLPTEDVGPFRGLSRFEEEDRDVYFGRTAEIAASIEMLRTRGLVALIGASGSGKSSLARAGVLPAIVDGELGWPAKWDAVVTTPGIDPWKNITSALGVEGSNPDEILDALGGHVHEEKRGVILLVDQLEELVTLSEETSRQLTVDFLARVGTRAIPGVRCLVAARRDLLDQLLALGALGRALTRGTMLVAPMTAATWGDVIDQALAAYGYKLEDDALRSELLSQLNDTVDAMPLVQFALTELWRRRDTERRVVPRDALTSIGGIAGALEMHAERVRETLVNEDRDFAETLYTVVMGTTTAQGTRAFIPRRTLEATDRRAARVIRKLEEERLFVREGNSITLTHEALLTQWARLRRWIDEARADRLLAEDVEREAEAWSAEKKREERVFRKRRLLAVEDLIKKSGVRLSETALDFVRAGRAAERRARIVVFMLAALFVAAGVAGLGRYVRDTGRARADAEQKAREARTALRDSLAAQAQSLAIAGGDPRESAKLALDALAIDEEVGDRSLTVRFALSRVALTAPSPPSRVRLEHLNTVNAAWFTADGGRVLTASDDRQLRSWDAATGKTLTAVDVGAPVIGARATPGGLVLFTTASSAGLWDPITGAVRKVALDDHGLHPIVALSPKGDRVFVGMSGLWDVSTLIAGGTAAFGAVATLVAETFAPDDGTARAVFSDDGKTLVTTTLGGTTQLWDARTGALIATIAQATFAMPSRDAALVVFTKDDGTLHVWDAATRSIIADLTHAKGLLTLAFSEDGTRVAAAGIDKTARIWDARTGALVHVLSGHTKSIASVAFSADASRVVTASDDHTAIVWDVASGEPLAQLHHGDEAITDARFSRNGKRVLTSGLDRSVRVWESQAPLVNLRLAGSDKASLSADDTHLVTTSNNATAQIWDIATGRQTIQLRGHTDVINGAAFSSDGTVVATAAADKTVRLWDARTGAERGSIPFASPAYGVIFGKDKLFATAAHTAWILDASGKILHSLNAGKVLTATEPAMAGDGSCAATGSIDNTVNVWDMKNGDPLATIGPMPGLITTVTLSTDGALVATAGGDRGAWVSDARTGKVIAKLDNQSGWVWSLGFSPDGKRLVTGSENGSVRVWDIDAQADVLKLHLHGARVVAATFSRDGSRILTASMDHTARVWDAKTGEALGLLPHGDSVRAALFTTDGRRVVTTSDDDTAHIWKIAYEDQLAFACYITAAGGKPAAPLCAGATPNEASIHPVW